MKLSVSSRAMPLSESCVGNLHSPVDLPDEDSYAPSIIHHVVAKIISILSPDQEKGWAASLGEPDQAEKCLRAILTAGADPAVGNEEVNTTLPWLVSALDDHPHLIKKSCHLLQHLTGSVDVTKKSVDSMLVTDYIGELLAVGHHSNELAK